MSLIDARVIESARCSLEERRELVPTIQLIVSLAEHAKREGLLALEDCTLMTGGDQFLSYGIGLVVDGFDPEFVRRVLEMRMLLSGETGVQLLCRLLEYEGILAIQSGMYPGFLGRYLYGMVSLDKEMKPYEPPARTDGTETAWQDVGWDDEQASDMSPPTTYPPTIREGVSSPMTFADIASLDDLSVRKLLREIDSQTLAVALKGAPSNVVRKVLANMSNTAGQMLTEDMSFITLRTSETAQNARTKVLETLFRLIDAGEIQL